MATLENPRCEAPGQARERVAEIGALQTEVEDVGPLSLLASLRRIVKAGESSENPTLVGAARHAIVDAARPQTVDRWYITKDFKEFSAVGLTDTAPGGEMERPSAPRQAPESAPPAPRGLPGIAPRAPHKLLASAAIAPPVLPGVSRATAGVHRHPAPTS